MQQLSVILFQNTEGKVLLQYRDSGAPAMPLMWSLFGGSVDEGELPAQAILREVQEELGLTLAEDDLVLLGNEVHTEESTRDVFLFTSKNPIRWSDVNVLEGAGAAFLSKEEVQAMGSITETAKYFVGKYIDS